MSEPVWVVQLEGNRWISWTIHRDAKGRGWWILGNDSINPKPEKEEDKPRATKKEAIRIIEATVREVLWQESEEGRKAFLERHGE